MRKRRVSGCSPDPPNFEGAMMKERRKGLRSGPASARHIARALLTSGLSALHLRVVGDRPHLEPDDLRSRDQENSASYDAANPREASGWQVGEKALFSSWRSRHHPAATSSIDLDATKLRGLAGCPLEVSPLLAHDNGKHPCRGQGSATPELWGAQLS